ncbi:Stress-related protein [Camellia lanceoleosa]|uniref:Stress-related protein n=1 Tax=Camellia lanceoleosa TaxID=1840588 RepID=A0ACC0IM77_9ERIC|nr:Stress-related protein [Camellia lanceoleosa]
MAESDLPNIQPQMGEREEEERLKYLEFVQVAMIHALMCFARLYDYAKDNSGPLKPGVETVEGTVKTVVGPVYDKFHDVPIELLKFVDRKVDMSVNELDRRVPPLVKKVSTEALSAAQKAPSAARAVASEVQRGNVVDTASGLAKNVYTKYEPAAKDLYTKYEPLAEQYAVFAYASIVSLSSLRWPRLWFQGLLTVLKSTMRLSVVAQRRDTKLHCIFHWCPQRRLPRCSLLTMMEPNH